MAINREAVFSDGTGNFLFPQEPSKYDRVTIRLRTAKDDIEQASLCLEKRNIEMKKESSDIQFDYFYGEFWLESQTTYYYFELKKEEEILFYTQSGVCEKVAEETRFKIIPGYKTPKWAKGAVMYQIFVDRFAEGNKTNTVENREYIYIGEPVTKVDDWNKYPAAMGVREFYGGDLVGVREKLDYLQDLGIEVLYLNPIFVSPSNHKYDTQDYDYIDPHFTVIPYDGGENLAENDNDNTHASKYIQRVTDKRNLEASNEFFAEFMQEVHRRGMKVILDGVFNHCGSFNKWLDREHIYEHADGYEKGAYVTKESPYNTFFKFYEDKWPYNGSYDGWWGHDTLPKLNYEESEKLRAYIMRIAKKWVSEPYNVDGWRLDVAADLGFTQEFNHKFWKEFRKTVKEANPEAIIIAEHYGDVTPWLGGDEWDSVMNYDAFMEPITWFLTGLEKHSDEFRGDLVGNADAFWDAMTNNGRVLICQSAQVAMNELSNHDHSRFLTRTNHRTGRVTFCKSEDANEGIDMARMRSAVFFQMTWVGAPTVYYGDEAGVCGWTDPDNRRTYPWGREDKDLIFCHKELIRIHKDYDALKTGSLVKLASEWNTIAYGRFDSKDAIFVVIYIGTEERDITLPIWKLGLSAGSVLIKMAESSDEGFSLQTDIERTNDGYFTIHLKPNSAVMWKNLYPLNR